MTEITKHSSGRDAKAAFLENLNEYTAGDHWMAAAWRVKDGKIELGNVTIHGFPSGDFTAAVGHLSLRLFDHLKNEQRGNPPEQEPLKRSEMPWRPSVRPMIMKESDGEAQKQEPTRTPYEEDTTEFPRLNREDPE